MPTRTERIYGILLRRSRATYDKMPPGLKVEARAWLYGLADRIAAGGDEAVTEFHERWSIRPRPVRGDDGRFVSCS